jgi:arabinofuranosyltransferase
MNRRELGPEPQPRPTPLGTPPADRVPAGSPDPGNGLPGNALADAARHTPAWERRAALLLFALGVFAFRTAIMDDTFIHLQYARNLRAAGELAFNRGEPSLGASSPLWVLLLAATGVGETGARLLSLACGAFSVLVFASLARRVIGRPAWARAATLAWAGNVWLVRHAPNGMETMAAVLLVLVAVELRSRGGKHAARDVLLGLALAGAVLARPEAALLVALFGVQDLTSRWGRDRLLAWLPALVIPCAAWFAFAHAETGHFLPATGAAKSGGIDWAPLVWLRVLRREASMLAVGHVVDLCGILLAAFLALRLEGRAACRRLLQHPLLPYAGFALGLVTAYALADVQVQPRYLLLVTPCAVLAGFAAWQAVLGGARAAALVCAATLLVGALFGARNLYPATRDFALGVEQVLKPMAQEVRRHAQSNSAVAAPDIGVMGYFSGVRVLDLGGLIEPRMQQLVARHGYDTVLAQGLFLDLGRVDFVLDRSPEKERFRDHTTRGLHWRVLRTGAVHGLGISRPETYYYTLYVLEPPSDFGSRLPPQPAGPAGDAPGAAGGFAAARPVVPRL